MSFVKPVRSSSDPSGDEFLTVAEIAGILELNQQNVRDWIDARSSLRTTSADACGDGPLFDVHLVGLVEEDDETSSQVTGWVRALVARGRRCARVIWVKREPSVGRVPRACAAARLRSAPARSSSMCCWASEWGR